jgi:hypothetical protein
MSRHDHHIPCPCGAELSDECPRCNSINPLGSMSIEPAIGSTAQPAPASGPDLLASLAVGVRLMDSHGIAPWSLHINRGERKVEAYIARADEIERTH